MNIDEQKRAETELRRSERCLREAERLARIETLERDLATNKNYWTPGLYDVLGVDPGTSPDTAQLIARQSLHPDDDNLVQAAFDRAIRTPGSHEVTYRLVLASGEIRVIHAIVESERDATGQPVLLRATSQDVTTYQRAVHAGNPGHPIGLELPLSLEYH